MQLGTFVTSTSLLRDGIKVYQSALPTKNEDRTVVLEFEHGTLIAIFDGHNSDELAEFASKHIPQLVIERFDPEAADIPEVMAQIFEAFDQSLISKVTQLFIGKPDLSDPLWDDRGEVHEVIGYGHQDPQFSAGRLATVGTTVLIGIIDKEKRHIWVVSLGDSDAVCGRLRDGKMTPIMLGDRHNCSNPDEVKRLADEHPNEPNLVQGNRVQGLLAVTRALGDHQMKVQSQPLSRRIMKYFYPSPIPTDAFEAMDANGQHTPPYLSSTPTVRRYELLPQDMLIFASDGLRDSMYKIPADDRWDILMALANGEEHEQLGHACIRAGAGDNGAELLIKNVLWGQDPDKMAKELAVAYRDDISVVIVDLGW
ncbi:phosphatase 2C-like domain-containing protein [Mycena pura]|uniref:Phosphatase 2C-like domain-containing protein n=1 Tax=Mycena pura TaxID=153505 RepID=A0AAD6XZE7_9AGAR|nr:phosphatase 2C-like domain-containing protein [Mycena pura]